MAFLVPKFRLFHVENYPKYGNCFTFNTELNEIVNATGPSITSLTAPSFGLIVVLKLEQNNYMKGGITKQVRVTNTTKIRHIYQM